MPRLLPFALLGLLAAAVVVPAGAGALGTGDVGRAACLQVEPVADTVVVTAANLAGAVGAGAVRSVLLASGVNCFAPGQGTACPLFRVTPAGAVYFLLVNPPGYAADCVVFAGPAYLGESAAVRYLGGGCGAHATVVVAGAPQSTPYVYWYCI